MQLVSRNRERLCQLTEDAGRHARCFGGIGDVGKADDELVAAETRGRVLLAQAGGEPRGNDL